MLARLLSALHRRRDPVGYARKIGVRIGAGCRLIDVDFGSEPWLVRLGDRVSATDTQFITHDGGVWVFREAMPDIDRVAPIVIGSNVFIGSRSIILPGVTIGDDVVIGAGSVVTRDIASGTIAAGVPARALSTLEAYRARLLPLCDPTKQMSSQQKRAFYEQKYAGALADRADLPDRKQ